MCSTDEHDRVFAELGRDRARLVVDAWADRTAALGALDGQIHAYPFLPPRVAAVLAAVGRHRAGTDGDLFADVVAAERSGPRNQAPVRTRRADWWLHLQLFSLRRAPGMLKYLAGSESGRGAFITDTNPEDVAEQLRAVVVG